MRLTAICRRPSARCTWPTTPRATGWGWPSTTALDRFTALDTQTFALKKSVHDRVLAPAHERLIGTRVMDNETDHELVIGSFHAAR